MRDDPNKQRDLIARGLMRRVAIIELQTTASEVAEIADAITRPLPLMPTDPHLREIAMTVQLCRERERCRRLLVLGWGSEPQVA